MSFLQDRIRRALRKELDKSADDLAAAWSRYRRKGCCYFERQEIKKMEQQHEEIKRLLGIKEES